METDFDSSYAFSALSEPFDGANMYFRYAMNLFIMENVNCFGKKYVEDGKCIFEASTESLECQYKTFLKTCPGSHLVLHRGLKLNSKISAGRRKKFARPNWFFTGKLSKNHVKKCRDSMKQVVTLSKTKTAREAFHSLTLMDNYKTFYSHVILFV